MLRGDVFKIRKMGFCFLIDKIRSDIFFRNNNVCILSYIMDEGELRLYMGNDI